MLTKLLLKGFLVERISRNVRSGTAINFLAKDNKDERSNHLRLRAFVPPLKLHPTDFEL